jgi:hypothetical protein
MDILINMKSLPREKEKNKITIYNYIIVINKSNYKNLSIGINIKLTVLMYSW